MKRHLEFHEDDGIVTVSNWMGVAIGRIEYYKRWKCYIWIQEDSCIMSADCLKEVINEMERLKTNGGYKR
jgi:hypothetical protein